MSDLCDPIDSSPPGSPVPGILQARTLEWVANSFSNAWKWKVKVKSFSWVRPSETPWTAAFQAPPSIGLSRQEYWSGVPLPSLKDRKQFAFIYEGHLKITELFSEGFLVSLPWARRQLTWRRFSSPTAIFSTYCRWIFSKNESVLIILWLLLLGHFSRVRLFVTLWIIACQAPLSVGSSRQDYSSGLPFPPSFRSTGDQTWVSYASCIGRWVVYRYCYLGSRVLAIVLTYFLKKRSIVNIAKY